MKFTIQPQVLQKLPDIKLGLIIIHNIDFQKNGEEMASKLQKSIEKARETYTPEDIQHSKDIKIWHEKMENVGIDWKNHTVSIESILKRIVVDKKDIGSINPLVDLYNSISINTLTPMGAYNLDQTFGDLTLDFATGEEIYRPLNNKKDEQCEKGELILKDQKESMCRYWVHKQSNTHKITPFTKNIIFRVEGIAKSDTDFQEVLQLLEKEIHENFHPEKIVVHVVDKQNPEIEFEKPEVSEVDLKIENLLNRGVADVIVREDLEKKLRDCAVTGQKLRIKLGIDPTGADLHIGHMVVVKKLKEFQDLGHQVVLLFGNFTGQLGDPTGKVETRKSKTQAELDENAKYYLEQISKVIDVKNIEVVWNADWLGKLSFGDVIQLASTFTVAQMMERDMFQDRIKQNLPIGVQEFMYPLMQGYDSVPTKADVEIGGTDQTFNLLAGRTIQTAYGLAPQNILTVPILEGLDGKMKMGKSTQNYIGVSDEPNDMYGKTMSIPDHLILRYFELATEVSQDEIAEVKEQLNSGVNPRDLKMKLARELVSFYHSPKEALSAEENFIKQFREGDTPNEMEKFSIQKLAGEKNIMKILQITGLVNSGGEARRLIEGGGVKIDGTKVEDINLEAVLKEKSIIQVGKRKFVEMTK